MTSIRRARILLTASWLVTQTALLISPSIVLLASAHEETAECTCAHGDHAICPMHHRTVPGSRICLIGSADDTLATLGSFFHAAGLMPSMTSAPVPAAMTTTSIDSISTITFRSVPPDPPPPRG